MTIQDMKKHYKEKLDDALKNIVEMENVQKQYVKAGNFDAARTQVIFIQRFLGIAGVCEEILKNLKCIRCNRRKQTNDK